MPRNYTPKPKPLIPNLRGERWIEIYGFPNYQISNMGRIKNVRRGNLVKLSDDGSGYLVVGLFYNKKRHMKRVARLVWNSFSQCDCAETIDHINRNKGDNRLKNLRCITMKENNENKKRENPKNKYNLTDEIKGEIAHKLQTKEWTTWTVMKKYGIPTKYTRSVRSRGSWNKYIQNEEL
jgi:phosphoribosylanthranilate isomerase